MATSWASLSVSLPRAAFSAFSVPLMAYLCTDQQAGVYQTVSHITVHATSTVKRHAQSRERKLQKTCCMRIAPEPS